MNNITKSCNEKLLTISSVNLQISIVWLQVREMSGGLIWSSRIKKSYRGRVLVVTWNAKCRESIYDHLLNELRGDWRSSIGGRRWWRHDWCWRDIARSSNSCSVDMISSRSAILWPPSAVGKDMTIWFAIITELGLTLWGIVSIILATKTLYFTKISCSMLSFSSRSPSRTLRNTRGVIGSGSICYIRRVP